MSLQTILDRSNSLQTCCLLRVGMTVDFATCIWRLSVKRADSTGRVFRASGLQSVRVFNARNVCGRNLPIGRVLRERSGVGRVQNEQEKSVQTIWEKRLINWSKRSRKEYSNAVFEKRRLAISALQDDLCLAWNGCQDHTGFRILYGVWAICSASSIGTPEGVNDFLYPHLGKTKQLTATN